MAAFLSAEWFDRLDSALTTITIGEPGEPGLSLGQVINDCPQGSVRYTIRIGAGRPGELLRDSVQFAQVTLVEGYPSALSVHEGASVAELLSSGQIKVRGDANVLLRASKELAALSHALGALQS